jgi:hypothetical protein
MNLITVIPLSRQKGLDKLTYFTCPGDPGRRHGDRAGALQVASRIVVTETRPALDLKAEIKAAPYEIRKLARVKSTAFFPAAFVDACKNLADWYAAPLGGVIDSLVAGALLENAGKIPPPLPAQSDLWNAAGAVGVSGGIGAGASVRKKPDETYAVQGDDVDRMSTWRSLIRQEFARKRSVAFYVPSIDEAKAVWEALQKGIEGYIFMLNGSLPEKEDPRNLEGHLLH